MKNEYVKRLENIADVVKEIYVLNAESKVREAREYKVMKNGEVYSAKELRLSLE